VQGSVWVCGSAVLACRKQCGVAGRHARHGGSRKQAGDSYTATGAARTARHCLCRSCTPTEPHALRHCTYHTLYISPPPPHTHTHSHSLLSMLRSTHARTTRTRRHHACLKRNASTRTCTRRRRTSTARPKGPWTRARHAPQVQGAASPKPCTAAQPCAACAQRRLQGVWLPAHAPTRCLNAATAAATSPRCACVRSQR
jgi:hypothetical protein